MRRGCFNASIGAVACSVLVVDDHPGLRAQARALLVAAGCEVVGEAACCGWRCPVVAWPWPVPAAARGWAGLRTGSLWCAADSQVDDLPDGGAQMIAEITCDG
jgi:hypothetical protein